MSKVHDPVARVSHVRFFTDMTRRSAPVVPLGVYMEVVWPKKWRWFGVLGREHVTEAERLKIGLSEFPEVCEPWRFLIREFDEAWAQNAGESCAWLAKRYQWALNVSVPLELDISSKADGDADMESWSQELGKILGEYEGALEPVIFSPNSSSGVKRRPRSHHEPIRTQTAKRSLLAA